MPSTAIVRPRFRKTPARLGMAVALLLMCLVAVADDGDFCSVDSNCDSTVELPTATDCAADDCACAQQIQCYITNSSPDDSWSTIPTGGLHWNAFFWHTRFLETYVSPAGEDAFRAALDPAQPMQPLPAGTILYKAGYDPVDAEPGEPDIDQGAEVFVAAKLEGGYCPSEYQINGSCQGGAWFWYMADYTETDTAPFFSAWGKPDKCTACHNTAERGDWMLSVVIQRAYPPQP